MLGNDGGGHLLPSHVQLITTECEKSKGGSLTTLSRSRECRMNQMKNTCMHRVYSRHLCTGSNQNTGPVSSQGVKTDHLSESRHVRRGHDTCHVSSL